MQSLSSILEKISRQKAHNERLFGPLLGLSPDALMSYNVSKTNLTRSDLRDKIRKIHSCAGLLEFRAAHVPDHNGTLEQTFKIHNATYCRHYTVCEICSRRVQLTRWKRFRDPIEKMVKRFPYVYHVTFTVTDGLHLGERIDFLQESFRNFVRQGQGRKSGKKSRGEWAKVGAAIVSTESKRGEAKLIDGQWVGGSDLWHSHKHALLFCTEKLDYQVYDRTKLRKLESKYGFRNVPKDEMIGAALGVITRTDPKTGEEKKIPVSKLSLEWYAATKGQGISIQARLLNSQNVAREAKEILKYPVKTSLKTNSDIPYIIEQTYNRRFLSTYGALRGLHKDEWELSETKDSKEVYLSQWTGYKYSDLTPGRPITYLPDEIKKKLFQRMAQATGAYRRERAARRKIYEAAKIKIMSDLANELDKMKERYRATIAQIVEHFANMPELANRVLRHFPPRGVPDAEQLSLSF